jgi:hypothetical protein
MFQVDNILSCLMIMLGARPHSSSSYHVIKKISRKFKSMNQTNVMHGEMGDIHAYGHGLYFGAACKLRNQVKGVS